MEEDRAARIVGGAPGIGFFGDDRAVWDIAVRDRGGDTEMAHPPTVTFPLFDAAHRPATAHQKDREEGEQNRDRCEGLTHHGTRMDLTTKGRLQEYGPEFAKSKKRCERFG